MRRCLLGALAWVLGVLLSAPQARAEQEELPASVRLVLADCVSIVDREALLSRLHVELLAIGVQELETIDPQGGGSDQPGERAATLQVYYPQCDGESGLVNLRISDRLTVKYVERALFVGDVSPEARPRTIALAIAELLRASWLELVLSKQAPEDARSNAVRNRMISRLQESKPEEQEQDNEVPPLLAPAPAKEVDKHAERWFKTRLEWIGASRLFPEVGSGDLSSAMSLSFALNRRLRLHVGALAAGGGTSHSDAARLFEAAGRVGVGVTGGNEIELEVASIFEVGWAQLRRQPDKQSSALVIGALHGTLRTSVTRGLDVLLGIQAGYVLAPLVVELEDSQGGTTTRGGIGGPIVGVSLGLAGIL